MRRTLTRLSVATLITLSAAFGLRDSYAESSDLPFGMRTKHLNVVLSISDPDKAIEFYGEVLGLRRLFDLPLPGDPNMLRFMGGDTEVKLIHMGQPLPKAGAELNSARGIRALVFFLPDSERESILRRIGEKGYPVPEIVEGEGNRRGFTADADGNHVELVFLDDATAPERFKEFQLALTVSDADEMTVFLRDIIGMKEEASELAPEGPSQQVFSLGTTSLKYRAVDPELPALVGGPFERIGMCLVQFLVPDVEAVRTSVLERGGKIHTEPFALGRMATIMFVDGPDGILFEFAGPLLPRFREETK